TFSIGAAHSAERPNVLLIVVDDLRPELACYGESDVHSPNVDRLAARGMRFDRAYCQYPICNPSRTSFLTGLRPETTQVFGNDIYFRTKLPDAITLPQLFRSSGYKTVSLGKIFHAGKLHGADSSGGSDAEHSWTVSKQFTATKLGQQGEGRDLTYPGGNKGWCRWLAAEGTDEDQPDGQMAAEAVRQLELAGDQPLFLAVGFLKPHDPFIAPKKYFDLYPPASIRIPSVPESKGTTAPLAIAKGLDFSKFTDQDRREFKRAYLAGVSFMDAQVGKLLTALDDGDRWQNTMVVFFGDHGYHLGEHHWWNKGTIFEESARVPFIFWSPEARGMGQSTRGIVELIDVYPTLCDLCGIKPPRGLEGESFRPLLVDPKLPGKPAAYTIAVRGQGIGRSVRTQRWRYTEWDGGKQGVELYDQQADPDDYANLAERPEYAATVAELKRLLARGG
ncbi:MAG TPA: sulfatase, partial [Pirellulales bacterium]|nr:sulfatase [Pirellulales bacterium]